MNAAQGEISRPQLILGTVQLGMPYGIANTSGKPDFARAREIIKTALDNNITHFDTAQAYGDSETILGSVLSDLGVSAEVHISTKINAMLDPVDTDAVTSAIEESFSRLRVKRLWCMLLHKPAWLSSWDTGLGDLLHRYQSLGRIVRLGVSLNMAPEASLALTHRAMEVLQAPCNAWDRRMEELGFLETARTTGRCCYVRSVYLQGLLTMPPEKVAAKLPGAREAALRWCGLAGEFGVSPKQLAFRYALSLKTPLVVGAESPEQIAETARLADLPPLKSQEIEAIASTMDPVLSEEIIEPWRWQISGS